MFFPKTSHLLAFYFINILLINYCLWKKSKRDPTFQLRRHGRIASILEKNTNFLYEWIQFFMEEKVVKKILPFVVGYLGTFL